MRYDEYKKGLEQDVEYLAAKNELKPMLDLADNILRLRIKKGWSQEELAERAGTRQANISKLESSQGNPTYKLLKKLADAFGEELQIIVGNRDSDSQNTITKIVPIIIETPVPEQPYSTSPVREDTPYYSERIPQ